MFDEGAPIFAQVADRLADEIADGVLVEGARVPSSNELATFYRINPATAAKGISVLITEGLLEKQRGVGMFVAEGARGRLLARRQQSFVERYVEPLVAEGLRLGIEPESLAEMVRQAAELRRGVLA
jgi:GntR family transcriptional regulator